MGNGTGMPSTIGLGQPPEALSKPLRLKMMRMSLAFPVPFEGEVHHVSGHRTHSPASSTLSRCVSVRRIVTLTSEPVVLIAAPPVTNTNPS
jgi:hypothetical protein